MAFSTMYGNVRDRARQSGTWAIARIKDYLNKAQVEMWIMAREWKQLEKQDTVSTVAGQSNYALPSDFVRSIHFNLEDGNNKYVLIENQWDTVRRSLNDNTANSTPQMYAIHYQQLYLSPPPDKVYTVRMDFIYKPTDMSADGDTTPFPEYILEEYAYAMLQRDLGRSREYLMAFQNWQRMMEEYAMSEGRPADGLPGFYSGRDGVSPYYDDGAMWGTRRSGINQFKG